jgi:phage terminase large subunit-like protein
MNISINHAHDAHQYAHDVVAGKITSCKWVKLACERHLKGLDEAKQDSYQWEFDEAKANKVCKFMELLPHVKGKWAAKAETVRLEPWQKFVIANMFGWVDKTTGLRKYRIVYICVPRKNGKSFLAAGIGLYLFALDGEFGAEVYSGATTEKQAWEIFRPAQQMCERTPALRERLGIAVNAKTLTIESNGSRMLPVIGSPGDGASPSGSLIDEYHEHPTDVLLDTMITGMGAREQPLAIITTTAGSNTAGPCRMLQSDLEKVLEGTFTNNELFGVIYTIDEGDDWQSEEALRKANPNYDVSVSGDFLKARVAEAVQSSRKQNITKTKHLNVWVNATSAFFNVAKWMTLADANLHEDQFIGQPCVTGLDLASQIDIAASVKVFMRQIDGVEHYYIFGKFYIPTDTVNLPQNQHYQQWHHEEQLIATPGSETDFSFIKRGILEDAEKFAVKELAFDKYQATHLKQEIAAETSILTTEIPQTPLMLSEPMKQLEAMIISGRIHHDGNPVMTWMIGNTVARVDANENVFPRKERPENKIDGVSALLNALVRVRSAITALDTEFFDFNGF